MPLPATYELAVEPAAIRFARKHLDQYYGIRDNPWGTSDPLISAGAGHAFFRRLLSPDVWLQSVELRMAVVALAKQGWDEAADTLRHVALEFRSQDQKLPTELENYEIEVRLRGNDRWPKERGPKGLDNMMRDLVRVLTVAALFDRFGLLPTGRSVRTVSGCTVVAKAESGPHYRVKPKTVERAWQRYGAAIMPTVPGWAHLTQPKTKPKYFSALSSYEFRTQSLGDSKGTILRSARNFWSS